MVWNLACLDILYSWATVVCGLHCTTDDDVTHARVCVMLKTMATPDTTDYRITKPGGFLHTCQTQASVGGGEQSPAQNQKKQII